MYQRSLDYLQQIRLSLPHCSHIKSSFSLSRAVEISPRSLFEANVSQIREIYERLKKE
jgi:7,8-dihydro-6-hydroxymethylpterin-pyrophosphokinase